MNEAAGRGAALLNIRDNPPGNLYATTVSPLFVTMGLLTVALQPKESFGMLRGLMANFSTSGSALTDDNGVINLRGFAGEYSMNVNGYNPISNVIHISEGKSDRVTVRVVRTRTAEPTSAVTVATSQVTSTSATSELQATALTGYFTYVIMGIIAAPPSFCLSAWPSQ